WERGWGVASTARPARPKQGSEKKPVQHMAAPGAVRVIWMVEVAGGIVSHAEALHHAAGAVGIRHGEGDSVAQAQPFEAKLQRRCGCLARIAMTPRVKRNPPADFDAGREMRLETWMPDAAETEERRCA